MSLKIDETKGAVRSFTFLLLEPGFFLILRRWRGHLTNIHSKGVGGTPDDPEKRG